MCVLCVSLLFPLPGDECDGCHVCHHLKGRSLTAAVEMCDHQLKKAGQNYMVGVLEKEVRIAEYLEVVGHGAEEHASQAERMPR